MTPQIRAKLAALREEFARLAKQREAQRRANYWRSVLERTTYHSQA